MKNHGKILEKGESTFMNGGDGAICGGVINQSLFDSDPWAYMMAYILPDKQFDIYKKLKKAKKEKEAGMIFKKYAYSPIG